MVCNLDCREGVEIPQEENEDENSGPSSELKNFIPNLLEMH